MTQDTETIRSNLEKYPCMKKFLGNIIEQRLGITCYTHGMLTVHLLDEQSEVDLRRLESALQLGQLYCEGFKQIFRGKRLPERSPQISEIADAQIIDILAEVKAFELLCSQGFTDITKVKHVPSAKTVDFAAKRNGENYAIEVTRLGLAQANRKKPKYDRLSSPPLVIMIDSKEPKNRSRIAEDIYDEIIDKYPQIKEFCHRKTGTWKGMLIISNGRDYFVAGRHERKLYELQPNTVCEVLKQEWQSLKGVQEYECLHHIVITMGKDLSKAIIYPSF